MKDASLQLRVIFRIQTASHTLKNVDSKKDALAEEVFH